MQAFWGCSNLQDLYLTGNRVVTLQGSEAFYGTPIWMSNMTGLSGTIHVPASLVASYKSANYWSYYSNIIVGV